MSLRHFHLMLCVAAVMFAVGCGSTTSQTNNSNNNQAQHVFLYAVANTGSINTPNFEIETFEFDPATSAITLKSSISLGSQIVPGMAIDPSGQFLYASTPGIANVIVRYSIDTTTGALKSAGVFNLTTICAFCQPLSGPGALAFTANGKFLYYGSSSGGGVTQVVGALAVDSTGALSGLPGSPFLADQTPFLVAVHPSETFVVTENTTLTVFPLPLSSISVFAVDPNTGALSETAGSPVRSSVSANVVGLAMHPSGKFVYASTGLAANGILGWNLDQTTGALHTLSASPFLPMATTFGGVFHPSGNFFYASAGASGGIHGFSVDPISGTLTPLANSPFDSGSVLLNPVVDSTGRFLFALDPQNKVLMGFAIDSTGKLSAVGNPIPVSGPLGQLIVGR